MESYLATPSLPSLDTGDQLLAGEELLLPTFRRVSGRTALHVALLRPGHESGRLAVLKEILSQDVPGIVNAQDDLGQSPLWYAAKGGFIGCARSLLRAGAFVSLGSMSSLQAAMRFLSATGSTRLTSRGEDIFRLLLRNGGSDCAEQVRDAETFLDTDLAVCNLETEEGRKLIDTRISWSRSGVYIVVSGIFVSMYRDSNALIRLGGLDTHYTSVREVIEVWFPNPKLYSLLA